MNTSCCRNHSWSFLVCMCWFWCVFRWGLLVVGGFPLFVCWPQVGWNIGWLSSGVVALVHVWALEECCNVQIWWWCCSCECLLRDLLWGWSVLHTIMHLQGHPPSNGILTSLFPTECGGGSQSIQNVCSIKL